MLAQVNRELHERVCGSPRYEALQEMGRCCPIDLRMPVYMRNPAEVLITRAGRVHNPHVVVVYLPESEV